MSVKLCLSLPVKLSVVLWTMDAAGSCVEETRWRSHSGFENENVLLGCGHDAECPIVVTDGNERVVDPHAMVGCTLELAKR